MFQKKSHYIFSDYTPTIDALLSVTMLSIIAIAVLSVPSPDSYMQDVRVNILTVQARQIAVPTTIALWPDLGVNYEIGKYESTPLHLIGIILKILSKKKHVFFDRYNRDEYTNCSPVPDIPNYGRRKKPILLCANV
jgi:hypothetical protein